MLELIPRLAHQSILPHTHTGAERTRILWDRFKQAATRRGSGQADRFADVKNLAPPAPVLVDVRDATVRADVARIEEVYEEHGARLWRALFLYAGDREVASDAVAEAFAQALRRGDDLRSPERWIWRSAFRIAAGELSRRSREKGEVVEGGYGVPEETAELLIALPRLTPKQRVAIVLHYYSGYSLKEVAKITGSTPSAVGVHLHRGRKRLRELLGDDE